MSVKPNRFFGLHGHTGASVYDGLGKPSDHFNFVLNNGGDGVAITEHGHMNSFASAWKYYQSLKKEGRDFKYVPGIEAYMHPSLADWEKLKSDGVEDEDAGTATIEDENASKRVFNPLNRRHHLVILPKNSQGLQDLFKLTSYGYTDGFYRFPRLDHFAIQQINKNKNLIATSACLAGQPSWEMFQECLDVEWDDVTYELVKDRKEKILPRLRNMVDAYVETFGIENYFLELQFNKLAPQHAINYLLIELSKETGVKLVATADHHYPGRDKWRAREMYKRIRPGNWMDDDGLPESVDELKCELFPKNADDMWEEYSLHKEKYDFYDDEIVSSAIERSWDIAHDMIGEIDADKKVKLPNFVIPEDKKPMSYLSEMAFEGLKAKGKDNDEIYLKRLVKELDVIKRKKFAKYFLTMKDIIDTLSEHMIIGPARGSSAGSLVCYCLNITKLDPIKYGLIFERFLNESRKDYPDIDTDVSDKDLAFKILQKKYGEDNAIAISNVNTLGLKTVMKDLAKFFNIDFNESNSAVKNVDIDIKKGCKKDDVDFNPKMVTLKYAKKYSLKFAEFLERYPYIEDYIEDLSGEQKSMGRHAGGILIADNIPSKMPVIISKKTRQTPWNKKFLEDFGWIKFDLLGLETLKIIENCIKLILENHEGIKDPTFSQINEWYEKHLNPDVMDLKDDVVFDHIYANGNYAGIFQCTNRDTQKLFSAFMPSSVEDISDLTALYRPGPMEVGAHWKYVKRKHGKEPIEYNHDLEKEFLAETAGLMCYQEQMMKMVNKIGDLSLPETDTFRKVVSKKPVEGDPLYDEMMNFKTQFIEGATSKDIDTFVANNIWDAIEAFAGYAFNKSHSISYAYNSYVTAWLLTHYEPEWLCAYMETQLKNPEEKAKAISELKGFNYDFAKIDINKATNHWIIVDGSKKLMPSFLSCKGVGKTAVAEIINKRPYDDIYSLLWDEDGEWRHSKFNKKNFSVLMQIGAFDSLDCVGEGRLFKNYAHMYRTVIDNWTLLRKCLKKDNFDTQCQKLEDLALNTDDTDWSLDEKLETYKILTGETHLDLIIPKKIQKKLDEKGYYPIDNYPDKKAAMTWFVLEDIVKRKTKHGKSYALMTVSGLSGRQEKLYIWDWSDDWTFSKNTGFRGWIKKNDFGYNADIENIIEIPK